MSSRSPPQGFIATGISVAAIAIVLASLAVSNTNFTGSNSFITGANFTLKGFADHTKLMQFNLAPLSANHTVTKTMPNTNGTVVDTAFLNSTSITNSIQHPSFNSSTTLDATQVPKNTCTIFTYTGNGTVKQVCNIGGVIKTLAKAS